MNYAKNAARRGWTPMMMLAGAMLASACGTGNSQFTDNPARTERAAEDKAVERPEGYCVGWQKIALDDASIDGLTDGDAEEILAHNLHGRGAGCWR